MTEGSTRIDLEMNNRGEKEKSLLEPEFKNLKMQVNMFLDSSQPKWILRTKYENFKKFCYLESKTPDIFVLRRIKFSLNFQFFLEDRLISFGM